MFQDVDLKKAQEEVRRLGMDQPPAKPPSPAKPSTTTSSAPTPTPAPKPKSPEKTTQSDQTPKPTPKAGPKSGKKSKTGPASSKPKSKDSALKNKTNKAASGDEDIPDLGAGKSAEKQSKKPSLPTSPVLKENKEIVRK